MAYLQNTVASILLVTTAVVFVCVVINYSVGAVEQNISAENNPQLDNIKNIGNNLLNETAQLFNDTQPQIPNQPPP